jgi:hypothetical protein
MLHAGPEVLGEDVGLTDEPIEHFAPASDLRSA